MSDQEFNRMRAVVTAAENVLTAAENDRLTASQLLTRLETIESRVESALERVPGTIEKSMNRLASATAENAAERLSEKFADANAAASEATGHYQRTSKNLHRKLWLSLTMFQLALAILIGSAVYLFIPSKEEIAIRRQEVSELKRTVADLERKGGKVILGTCDNRLCVRTDSSITQVYGEHNDFRIILGY